MASRGTMFAAWPSGRQIWFQLHWLIGIVAGTVLMLIGLSGAVLSFREELIDLINPGARTVAVQAAPTLLPPQLLAAVREQFANQQVGTLAVFAKPGAAARVIFAPGQGERRGDTVYLDPYSGRALPPIAGAEFFEWVETFHRWLLLPREAGRVATGVLAACLLFLSLSGLYLRWPRRVWDWRAWLSVDPSLKGRPFLWGLHSVAGTLALLMYLVFAGTGIYWAFDAVREQVDAWAGEVRMAGRLSRAGDGPTGTARTTTESTTTESTATRPTTAAPSISALSATAVSGAAPAPIATPRMRNVPRGDAGAFYIQPAWTTFEKSAQATGGWSELILRVQVDGRPSVLFTWLDTAPAHERARNRTVVSLSGGEIVQDERYAAKSQGGRFIAAIYPLHMGSYFGLPGRIVMTLAALMLPLFGITGWMLYLDRRRKKRALQAERTAMAAVPNPAGRPMSPNKPDGVLVTYASQSGTAEGIALRSAAVLEAAGMPVKIMPLNKLDPAQLQDQGCVLIVASTFGEGEPPDMARRFARQLSQASGLTLPHLRYGLLALGDRHYEKFCGFGHTLDRALAAAGAQALFPMLEVDGGDGEALAAWSRQLQSLAGVGGQVNDLATLDSTIDSVGQWRLATRTLVNAGSQGNPLYDIAFLTTQAKLLNWQPGALVELRPPNTAVGAVGGSNSSAPDGTIGLAPRRYSIASLPQDEHLRLFVRQARHANGLGIASGWLTEHAPLDTTLELRVLRNPGFELIETVAPCIFIGNGSGYAGLRGHLRARIARGHRRNWFLFGERHRAHDAFCADEVEQWHAQGHIERVDLVFSRDQPERLYVQDRLRDAAAALRHWVGEGAVIYVCGSLSGMAAGVDLVLEETLGQAVLNDLVAEGRLRRDVY
ncbi:nitric oxide synthase [Pigmentiphaga aceris]|uniref:Nitric oxide synthase n=1 Tax=Pigmentiphaga aceris TaxID=1940612 RepID=A0A5C0AVS2_9BURK|nr:sulfite reductase flavoprotein subunit alpha [Pigmentiphaga aceris]QEI06458.1 nitric oxide synthase [Pigmentiphaga aceris]